MAILAVMLFPVYWMINGSLQPSGESAGGILVARAARSSAIGARSSEQGANLLTSLIIAIGSAAVSLVIATPAAYALAHFRLPGVKIVLLGILISQMIPGIVVANALYAGVHRSRPAQLRRRADPRRLHDRHPVRDPRDHGVHGSNSRLKSSMPPGWTVPAIRVRSVIVVPVSRNALITAGIFAFLFAWSDFLFALTLTTETRCAR